MKIFLCDNCQKRVQSLSTLKQVGTILASLGTLCVSSIEVNIELCPECNDKFIVELKDRFVLLVADLKSRYVDKENR